ncbi:MAG: NADH-quinone oxidoreductase subunit L, partial [Actinomycetia bacterium]|nr:NADH-quinone oxidoreductase subunit L [Actinomycetes bacterium]
FGFLNLFAAAMLTLVLGGNYVMVFIGWEGVGLASYLLIGFWQQRRSAALAAKKAFLVNKLGDLGLLMAVMMLFAQIGSVDFDKVDAGIGAVGTPWVGLIGFGLLLAACGKSAQVPLQSWLLDAMEGPTPVSALIHAATMVTAGVYLVVRSHSIYALAPAAQTAVAVVGTVTLLVGAWIGCAKTDIKKVLAGSTMSQIGYMMLAAGLGPAGGALAIFHLLTHGAFKANMFLGAGSVMHGMDDSTDIRTYGALRKAMPWTAITFACGYLAIIGFPFTAGYYSKDHIIVAAFAASPVYGVCAILGAGVTAFYMTRLVLLTFTGRKRWAEDTHPHESPAVMTVPLVFLAVLGLGLGLAMNGWIQGWLAGALNTEVHDTGLLDVPLLGIVALAVVAIGVLVAWLVYRAPEGALAAEAHNPLVLAGENELYMNQAVDAVVVRPGAVLAAGVAATDRYVVEGSVRGVVHGLAGLSLWARGLQNGMVRSYALLVAFGAVVVAGVMLVGIRVGG